MRVGDDVKVLVDDEKYLKEGVHKGMIGYINMPEIRDNSFMVTFIDENFNMHEDEPEWFEEHFNELKNDIFCIIKIEDLELVQNGGCSDEELFERLPKNDPKWWCKVEDGYIMNLLGEKKNKIPYDYNS